MPSYWLIKEKRKTNPLKITNVKIAHMETQHELSIKFLKKILWNLSIVARSFIKNHEPKTHLALFPWIIVGRFSLG